MICYKNKNMNEMDLLHSRQPYQPQGPNHEFEMS